MNNKVKKKITKNLPVKTSFLIFLSVLSFLVVSSVSSIAESNNTPQYSFYLEGGETESVFIIDGRNFPVKVGSFGLKASFTPGKNNELFGKIGFGYSQKQSVSAFDFNLSGSVLASSFGGGASKKFPIGDSNFLVKPFVDLNIFNYSSRTFRGERDGDLLKANVKGNSSFLRSGIELQYETQNGYFFFGTGLSNWDISNEISIKTGNLTITPRVWADEVDSFFQAGVSFDTGNSDAVIGVRMSDLTFDINTQLVEIFAEVQVSFGKSK